MSNKGPTIKAVSWADHESEIHAVRHEVFVLGLGVPEERDFDGSDAGCRHVLAYCDGKAVGTGRIKPDGHIGRIAVLKAWRGRKAGSAILQRLMDMATQEGLDRVYLNSQKTAIGFYEKFGFHQVGETFIDAGIEHVRMENAGFTKP